MAIEAREKGISYYQGEYHRPLYHFRHHLKLLADRVDKKKTWRNPHDNSSSSDDSRREMKPWPNSWPSKYVSVYRLYSTVIKCRLRYKRSAKDDSKEAKWQKIHRAMLMRKTLFTPTKNWYQRVYWIKAIIEKVKIRQIESFDKKIQGNRDRKMLLSIRR